MCTQNRREYLPTGVQCLTQMQKPFPSENHIVFFVIQRLIHGASIAFLTLQFREIKKFNQRLQIFLLKNSLDCFHYFPSVISKIREMGFGKESIKSQSLNFTIQGKEMLPPVWLTSASHHELFSSLH